MPTSTASAAWRWVFLAVCAASLLRQPSARADAVIVTKAMTASTVMEVFIEKDAVRVELEIGADDLQSFKNLLPDLLLEKMGIEALPVERLRAFFMEDLTIRMAGGQPAWFW